MPARNVALIDTQATRLEVLRQTADIGIADMEAGRFLTFESSDSLQEHLTALAEKAIQKSDSL